MRNTMTAIAAVLALAAGAAPAAACEADGAPCGGYHYNIYSWFEHLPYPEPHPVGPAEPRYYFVDQGPAYSGPGMYAPVPTYQERAVNGWRGYDRGYYYGYYGGPYGDATSHRYDGMPAAEGPVVYRYGRFGHHHHRHHLRYGGDASTRYANGYGARIVRVPHE